MSTTCKSPRRVLLAAWRVAKAVLPAYSHPASPKKFTQHQLFACLVLKAFLKTDYRGLATCLQDAPTWREAIELAAVPHFTTFQKAAQRLLRAHPVAELLDETVVQIMRRKRRVALAAIDSTGLESRHTSRYFIHRRSREPNLYQTTQYTRYPKLGLLVDCSNHAVLGYLADQGPKPDVGDLRPTLAKATPRVRIEWLTGDAGYDSEANHRLCREALGIRSLIPAKHGRPTDKPASGRYRRLMQTRRFDKKRYGQRWQVETVVSMMKRRLGSSLSGRTYWSRRRDLMLMVLTHNIMIRLPLQLLQKLKVFYRARMSPLFCPPFVLSKVVRTKPLPPDVRTPRTVQACGAEGVRASSPAATVNAPMPDAPHKENEHGGENAKVKYASRKRPMLRYSLPSLPAALAGDLSTLGGEAGEGLAEEEDCQSVILLLIIGSFSKTCPFRL